MQADKTNTLSVQSPAKLNLALAVGAALALVLVDGRRSVDLGWIDVFVASMRALPPVLVLCAEYGLPYRRQSALRRFARTLPLYLGLSTHQLTPTAQDRLSLPGDPRPAPLPA